MHSTKKSVQIIFISKHCYSKYVTDYMKKKRTKKISKKIRKKVKKKIAIIKSKKIKGLKINKQINQIKALNLKLKKLNSRAINKQIRRLKGLSLQKSGSFIYQSLNKAYGDFKEKRKIERLKQIKFEKKEKSKTNSKRTTRKKKTRSDK